MSPKRIYLDNTATTKTRREVIHEMKKYFSSIYANPSSIHQGGLIARGSLELARERIAVILNCNSEELIFTGSGSESNNLAITGIAEKLQSKGNHIISSPIEHKSVLATCKALSKKGFSITWLPVDRQGHFDLEQLEKSITDTTILVSLGYVNNEIGTVQDIKRIVEIVKSKNVLLHLDAVQALPYFTVNLKQLGADLVSFSGHKLYAPKGIGILYIKKGVDISPLIYGGEQEFAIRSGTENVPYAMGLSKAINCNSKEKNKYSARLCKLRNLILDTVPRIIDDCIVTGDPENRAPNHTSFCFKGINGKMLIKELSKQGFEVSSGSACSSPRNDPSHVLEACSIPDEYIYGGMRVTLGKYNTRKNVRNFLKILPRVITKMRTNKSEYNNDNIFISQYDFIQKQNSNDDLIILDLRDFIFPRKRIAGSIHAPGWRLKSIVKKLNKTQETILVCYQGDIISPKIQQYLIKKGFTNVRVLKGGIFAYFKYIY